MLESQVRGGFMRKGGSRRVGRGRGEEGNQKIKLTLVKGYLK